jgi:hypothetical protein
MIFLTFIDNNYGQHWSIEVSTQGHSFITLIVSFLLVSRVNIALGRYNDARGHIGTMYQELRELACYVCVYTYDRQEQVDKEWRHEVAYRGLILLRTAMAVIDYPDTKVAAWNLPELNGIEMEEIKRQLLSTVNDTNGSIDDSVRQSSSTVSRYGHKARDEWDETMRVPIRLAYLLRKSIHLQVTRLSKEMVNPQEAKILGCVDAFMNGYYGIRKFLTTVSQQCVCNCTLVKSFENVVLENFANSCVLLNAAHFPDSVVLESQSLPPSHHSHSLDLTTIINYTQPVPFPLIQMARTFLFLYIFTVPFVMLADDSGVVPHCFAVFIMTYGFLGLEVVAIELDNPFGSDENDFDNSGMAENAYEDTYLTILDVDGQKWADKLRKRMDDQFDIKNANNESWLNDKSDIKNTATEETMLLDEVV